LLLLVVLLGFRETDQEDSIVGEWIYSGTSPSEYVECPDLLVIERSGHYTVFNDCYGHKPTHPIVETGRWVITEEHVLKLFDRDTGKGGGYRIWSNQNTQEFTVDWDGTNVMHLTYPSEAEGSDICEIWTKSKN